jgi:hypothetical protein
MNTDEALKIIAKTVESGEIDLKTSLTKHIKQAYGVEDLIFWCDNSGWHCCGFKAPKYDEWHHFKLCKRDDLDDLLYLLKSLKNKQGTVFFGKTRFDDLNALKEEMLIRKLSGIL